MSDRNCLSYWYPTISRARLPAPRTAIIKTTVYLTDLAALEQHVFDLVEFSHICDFMGLPHDVWAVRELLPTKPICTLPHYRGFPLVREVRAFIGGGKVTGWHPYWPPGSIIEGFNYKRSPSLDHEDVSRDVPPNIEEIIAAAHAIEWEQVKPLAQAVATAFAGDGEWSVDILETERGWYVTDMADAARSFKWEEGMRTA